MGRNKHGALAAAAASRSVRERHHRAAREHVTVPHNLVVLPEKNIQSKHKSYFQLFENKDGREKKLEYKVTTDLKPPPGHEFLPSGNPDLTKACKELSREQDAMIFVVSGVNDHFSHGEEDGQKLALQVHRMGHHVRHTILEQAKNLVGKEIAFAETGDWQLPETQEEINAQAEAAMRDLFPRIPNFDKDQIIEHAFKKDKNGKALVGTSDLPLYRRVQLAVLAHIRHVHTTYDRLLKQVPWKVARKAVERQCLDILVKWRGDEETGRDKIGDILREVVVISDADDDSDPEDADDSEVDEEPIDADSVQIVGAAMASPRPGHIDKPHDNSVAPNRWWNNAGARKATLRRDRVSKPPRTGHSRKNTASKRDKRGFDRYEAAMNQAMNQRWEEAVTRSRRAQTPQDPSGTPLQTVLSEHVQRSPSLEIVSAVDRNDAVWNDHTRPASQSFDDRRQRSGHLAPPDPNSATNSYRPDRIVPHAARPSSGFGPSHGAVVGRRVAPAPQAFHNGPPLGRLHHEELKDFLVPSVEPRSPHSSLDGPQTVQRVVREEQMYPEQVPAGPPRQYIRMESRPMAMAPLNHHVNTASRPAGFAEERERHVSQRNLHHERDPRLHSTHAPQEEHREYFVREAIYDPHHPPGHPTAGTSRVVRVHRDTRPMEMQVADPHRPHEFSPRRSEATGHSTMSSGYAPEARRRIEYREASASGPGVQSRGPLPGPGRPLYYELQGPVQAGSWQGSTSDSRPHSRPQYSIPIPPQDPRRYYDNPVRQLVHHGAAPVSRAPVEHGHRGYTQHERTPSSHAMQLASPSEPGSVQYLYERTAPRPSVIY